MTVESTPAQLSARLKERATGLGFDLTGITAAASPSGFSELVSWLEQRYHGEMSYLSRREEAYQHPDSVLPSVRSVVMLGMNYRTTEPGESAAGVGRVSRYAWGSVDYHDLLRERLRSLAADLHDVSPGCKTRGVVDTAPLLERDFARLAGLGWFGKNTMLINKAAGSWFFLAALLTDVELKPDAPHETSHCGTCTRCLEACPTDAFVSPYVLDARRCISYLTIELRTPIPLELREGVGDWLFGCDVCQEVCPWNRKAPTTTEAVFHPQTETGALDLLELFRLTPEQFKAKFQPTPLSRPQRTGILRNAAIVLGNQRNAAAVPVLCAALEEEDPLIRGAVAWALGQTGGIAAKTALQSRLKRETDPDVVQELQAALQRVS